MAFLNVTIPQSGQYQGYATRNANHCVVIPLSVSSNDSILFDDNVSTSIPLFSGVIFEYDSTATFQNFQISGTAGDSFLLWFDSNGDATGPHYVVTSGANFNANITNGTLNTNANITNSTLNTNANITNSSINTNITNATLNTNANITNSSLTTTVNGTVNESISGTTVTVYQSENLPSGSFLFATPVTINMSNTGAYVALQITLAPQDQIIINSFAIESAGSSNLAGSNWYAGSTYALPTESMWGALRQSVFTISPSSTLLSKVGSWTAMIANSSTSALTSSAANVNNTSWIMSVVTWEGRLFLINPSTTVNQTFYLGIQHSGSVGEQNVAVGYGLALNYQGLTSSSSSIQGIYSQGSGGQSGSGGSGGGGGKVKNLY